MLLNLHVKNMALIKEADIDFKKGLNILTGETGAGKSLLLGSVNLCLGAKATAGIIRHGCDQALVELTFSIDNKACEDALSEAGYEAEDGCVIITRKITESKSTFRINGESCTASQIKSLAGYLLDIHGQHDHQSLLYNDKQLAILDGFGGEDISSLKDEVKGYYDKYSSLRNKLKEFDLDENQRLREIELLEYEIEEIENAALKDGEEEELETRYKIMENSKDIVRSLDAVHNLTGYENGAGDLIGKAIKEISGISDIDETISELYSSLMDVDSILSDINRSAALYLDDFSFSDEDFNECEKRLDEIRRLFAKYGNTTAEINSYLSEQIERLEFLNNYAEEKEKLLKDLEDVKVSLDESSKKLSKMRQLYAKKLSMGIVMELKELNFLDVRFDISFEEKAGYHKDGIDKIDFLIALNVGENLLPLSKAASGGELSRIMLAIKTILSNKDPCETLIFDEIDTGISGKTAVFVADKLKKIAKNHQVICITHLAQIAAMADAHYVIEKKVKDNETFTFIDYLDEEASVLELARILGGSVTTEAVINNAKELKASAKNK